jgi:hypothetical protein
LKIISIFMRYRSGFALATMRALNGLDALQNQIGFE